MIFNAFGNFFFLMILYDKIIYNVFACGIFTEHMQNNCIDLKKIVRVPVTKRITCGTARS